ncbi:MAG: sulfite exporter TauE/SafE family protein [Bacteroidia bacterium]|nr:sulfite exporter TauE/SafE family protein [Bacteroidia bacterium]
MTNELIILVATTASVALIHTLTGPDHYLPFIMISKARNWKMKKTIWFTALCGAGHVGSSVLLGFIGISLGLAVEKLELFEGVRGSIVTWLFTSFGLIYMIWGLQKAYKNKIHKHLHFHDNDSIHEHDHTHHNGHVHIHESIKKANVTPWILFTIFIFGPCEPLIPIVIYPAAKHNYPEMIILTVLFSLITISTMIVLVTAAWYGFKFLPMQKIERYSHALAGGTIFVCGLGMLFLGL